jgi:small subunit ribosomal protein S10
LVVEATAAAAPAAQQKIRIKLKSYWVDLLQEAVEKIADIAATTGASIAGPVPLPTR